MSTARHHAEWLALTEISGPFLSLGVLLQVFPQGLDAHEPEHFRLFKQAYQEWSLEKTERSIHRAWIEWVLQNTLEFPPEVLRTGQAIPNHLRLMVEQHQEILIPDWVLVDPETDKKYSLATNINLGHTQVLYPCAAKLKGIGFNCKSTYHANNVCLKRVFERIVLGFTT